MSRPVGSPVKPATDVARWKPGWIEGGPSGVRLVRVTVVFSYPLYLYTKKTRKPFREFQTFFARPRRTDNRNQFVPIEYLKWPRRSHGPAAQRTTGSVATVSCDHRLDLPPGQQPVSSSDSRPHNGKSDEPGTPAPAASGVARGAVADSRGEELPREWGLCSRCALARVVRSKRSAFMRCGRSDEDKSFSRYPPLPVLECDGFVSLTGTVGGR